MVDIMKLFLARNSVTLLFSRFRVDTHTPDVALLTK